MWIIKIRQHQASKLVLPVLVALIFILLVLLFFPFRDRFQFDGDEGINLMKAMLMIRGYALYNPIWSDQPPLLTYLLVLVFQGFGIGVNLARLTVLFLSATLLWACFRFLQMVWGTIHAVVGTLLIILLPFYMILSVSVMVGLPSIALAMLSLVAVTAWHLNRRYIWIILSAIAFAGSVFIKLFTGFLGPIIVLGILLDEFSRSRGRLNIFNLIRPGVLWIGVLSIIALTVVLFVMGTGNLNQLYESHSLAVDVFQREIFTINHHLQDSMTVLFLSLFGILFTILAKRWLNLYLILWMVTAYVALWRHSPVWYHHQLLITIPAAMLGGIAAGETVRWMPQVICKFEYINIRTVVSLLTLGAFSLVLFDQIPDIFPKFERGANRSGSPLRASSLLEDAYLYVQEYAPETQWMITDMPMFAFRFNIPIPPNLVVLSAKRLKTNLLTESELLDTIQDYDPEQVLLREKVPAVETYLDRNYQLVYTRRDLDLYIRNDVYLKHKSGN